MQRSFALSMTIAILFGSFPLLAASTTPLDDGRDALRRVDAALRAQDAEALDEALAEVIRVGGEKPMETLLKRAVRIPEAHDGLYWKVLGGIASFVDEEALVTLGKFLARQGGKPIARDLLHTLLQSRTRRVVFALEPLLEDGSDDVRLQVVTKLGTLPFIESVDLLVQALEAEEKKSRDEPTEIAWVAAEGLTAITGKEFGTSALNWRGWWDGHRDEAKLGSLRLREGGKRTGTAVDFLDSRRAREFVGLEKAPTKGVIVLSAFYPKVGKKVQVAKDFNNDRMERVLERMGVPHEVVNRPDFLDFDLSETGAILINCARIHKECVCPDCKPAGDKNNRLRKCSGCNVHEIVEPALSDAAVEKLKKFVDGGGYVFCEDWVVKEFVERAFPKIIVAGKKLTEDTVSVVPARGRATHSYLRGVWAPPTPESDDADFLLGDDDDDDAGGSASRGRTVVVGGNIEPKDAELLKVAHRWRIDDESFALEIVDRGRVVPLLASGDLEGDHAVALAFRGGSGKLSRLPIGERRAPAGAPGVVVQVLSHFGKQESSSDERSIENLLLNFLIDANVARERRASGSKGARRR